MGASGAGKSTLLNTFLFRYSEGLDISGTRIADGEVVTPTNLTSVSAYVQQEDLFIPSLSVKEHLVFQSRVRMDKHLSRYVKGRTIFEKKLTIACFQQRETRKS